MLEDDFRAGSHGQGKSRAGAGRTGASFGRYAIAAALFLSAFAPPATAGVVPLGACPAERALYELRDPESAEVWKLRLVPARHMASMASNLYLNLVTPQRGYWFTFSVSQGYGGISILPISDPYIEPGPRDLLEGPEGEARMEEIGGFLRFLAFDKELGIANDPPNRGDEAPSHILLPELGQGLWYSAAAFTEDPAAERDPMPRGLFRRSGCLADATPEALP